MLMHKLKALWTPGTCDDQIVEASVDGAVSVIVGNSLGKDIAEFTFSVPAGTKTVSVKVGSRAPGQVPVYSEEVLFDIPTLLTAPTNLSLQYLGTEEVA